MGLHFLSNFGRLFTHWLCWVLAAAQALLWLQQVGTTLVLGCGLSLRWLLLLQRAGSGVRALQCSWPVGSRAQAQQLLRSI